MPKETGKAPETKEAPKAEKKVKGIRDKYLVQEKTNRIYIRTDALAKRTDMTELPAEEALKRLGKDGQK